MLLDLARRAVFRKCAAAEVPQPALKFRYHPEQRDRALRGSAPEGPMHFTAITQRRR